MNKVHKPSPRPTKSRAVSNTFGNGNSAVDIEQPNLTDWLANLWEDRYIIIVSTLLLLLFGWFNVWRSAPLYQSEAMLQIQPRKVEASDAAFIKMQSLFPEPTDAQAEIELLKSNKILESTINTLHLDISVKPKVAPVIGYTIYRRFHAHSFIDIDFFSLPERFRGDTFFISSPSINTIKFFSPTGVELASGRVGEILTGMYQGEKLQLRARQASSDPKQLFQLSLIPSESAIAALKLNFDVVEKGKLTNVLGLTYKDSDPAQAATVLSTIISQYMRQKADLRASETSKTLSILQAKMPELKTQLDAAETRLNQFRVSSGSVDLSRQADLALQQNASLNAQITTLLQKKEDLMRTYKEDSDVVTTVNQQITRLRAESTQTDSLIRSLPSRQQEFVRLSRDVQVNTELYTALLNNIQQLQVSNAGELNNVILVDSPKPSFEPIGPKPLFRIALFGFLGLVISAGVIIFRRSLRVGVKDHRLIESKLGLPILVTIPHSKLQEKYSNLITRKQGGQHLLSLDVSDDLTNESLRSLRTTLHFSMRNAKNNIIMITGPSPGIGKSFVSSNLACILAQTGCSVLLIDGDLRKGNLHSYFGLKNRMGGLSEILTGRLDWSDAIKQPGIPNLSLICTGILPPDPSELLLNIRFSSFITSVSQKFQYIIIDAPPILAVTDATIIGASAGATLLVAKYGRHPLDELETCQKRFESNGIQLSGCIFNDIEQIGLGYSYATYRYAYHYKYK
jgi:tyrosine-protein kinase Etk/Wzc